MDGLKKANNLSDISGAANRTAARDNLDVLWADDARGMVSSRASRGGLMFDGATSFRLTGALSINPGLSDFSVAFVTRFPDYTPSTTHTVLATHTLGNNKVQIQILTDGRINVQFHDNGGVITNYSMTPDVALVDGEVYHIVLTCDRDGLATLYVNGVSDRSKDGSASTVSIAAAAAIDVGFGNANPWAGCYATTGTLYAFRAFNRLLSAAEVLALVKTGNIDGADQWGSSTALSSGTFTVGRRYRIASRTDGDFTTVGAANNSVGTEFIATGTGAGILDAGDTALSLGAILDLDLHNALPSQSLAVRDRSSNANQGTAAATGVVQVLTSQQINAQTLTVGAARVLTKLLSETAALNFGSVAAAGSADLTMTVNGAAVGDSVSLGLPNPPPSGITFQAFVSAMNTVTIRATNITAGAIDPASMTFRVTVMQF